MKKNYIHVHAFHMGLERIFGDFNARPPTYQPTQYILNGRLNDVDILIFFRFFRAMKIS